MQIVYKKINELIPYGNNPRINDDAVEYVANSIRNFGFKIPIIIDADNVIVCGHTRLKASTLLGLEEVPCIVADDLSEEQIKAFRLADNKVSEKAQWDLPMLMDEIDELFDFDMGDFGFDVWADMDKQIEEEFEHEKNVETTNERKADVLHTDEVDFELCGKYDIPKIKPVYELPEITEWIGFNYVLSDDNPEGKAVHFFLDDYQFERIWNNPEKYVEKLKRYVCVASPDFSPWANMPMATQIFNHYRKHWVGAWLQQHGVTVIPTIRASADVRSAEWFLDGEPEGGIIILSTMWQTNNETEEMALELATQIENKLKPCKIFAYGKEDKTLKGNIEYIENFTSKRFKE